MEYKKLDKSVTLETTEYLITLKEMLIASGISN